MAIELTKELLTTEAEKQARCLVSNSGKESKTTSSQIRKFYNDFLLLKNKADLLDEEEFKKEILPLVYFSKAKLAYSYGRDNSNIAKEFVDDLNNKIDRIETKRDFNNFINYYQALIGYITYQFKVKDEEAKQQQKIKISSRDFKARR